MLDSIAAAILFLFGIQSGSVRGDSTVSATPNVSNVKNREDLLPFRSAFDEKHTKANANWISVRKNFVESLEKISDTKKQTALETIQDRLTAINSNQTNILMLKLTYMSAALDEIETEANLHNKQTGRGIVNITNAITAARGSVASAMALVTTQVGKTYVIKDASNGTGIKERVMDERNKLAADLKPVREAVAQARKKTSEALKALRQATGKTKTISIQPKPLSEEPSGSSVSATPTLTQ